MRMASDQHHLGWHMNELYQAENLLFNTIADLSLPVLVSCQGKGHV
jgi:hypothetical protein